MIVVHLALLAFFLAFVGRLASGIARRSLTEWFLVSFLLFAGSVIATGWILSALYLTANATVWGFAVFGTATLLAFVLRTITPRLKSGGGVNSPFANSFQIADESSELGSQPYKRSLSSCL